MRAIAARHLLPFRLFRIQLLPSSRGKPVVLELPIPALWNFPLRVHPPFALKPVGRRIERDMFNLQESIRRPLNMLGDLMTVASPVKSLWECHLARGTLRISVWTHVRPHEAMV